MKPDFHSIALEIISLVDYDIYKEIKSEPNEDETLETIVDKLYDIYEQGKSDG